MSDMDRKILEVIKAEADTTLRDYERDLGFFGLMAESFKGTFRWAVMGAVTMQVILGACLVYCTIRLFGTNDTAAKIDWLALGLATFIAFGLLRIWFFMEINRLSVSREIKRLELQVAAAVSTLTSVSPKGPTP